MAKSSVTKTASLDNTHDEYTFVPDRVHWERELDVFRQLSAFQKPAYRRYYEIRDHVNDPHSNLLVRSYRATREIPVREIRFYYARNFHNMKKIEAVYTEQNALFFTSRKLLLEFDDTRLRTYRVAGDQKMFGGDTVHFLMESRIHL